LENYSSFRRAKCQRAAQFGGANDPFILVTASGKVNFRGASFVEFPHLS
jgi:hypothetical protein